MENTNKNAIRENILKYRAERGWTQADLAERIKMKTSTYATKEAKGNFKTSELWLIADALKVDIKEFFFLEAVNTTETNTPQRFNDVTPDIQQNRDILLTAKEEAIIRIMRSSKQNKDILLSVMSSLHEKAISQDKLNKILEILNND